MKSNFLLRQLAKNAIHAQSEAMGQSRYIDDQICEGDAKGLNLPLPLSLELAAIQECGLPAALEVMGERWSFLILRSAFNGVRHFEDFLETIGIARNILSNRLSKLVEHGIMRRDPCAHDRRKVEYRLTEKGMDLLPAMLALRQWGEKYGMGALPNTVLVDTTDHLPISPIAVRSHDGRLLKWSELKWQVRE